jgi:hypothetical protein
MVKNFMSIGDGISDLQMVKVRGSPVGKRFRTYHTGKHYDHPLCCAMHDWAAADITVL